MATSISSAALILSTPDFLVGLSGRGVRVAVIDSGAHPDHPHIAAGRLSHGIAIASDGSILDDSNATLDRLGHGTAVMAAIQEKAPAASYLPVRVFHDALRTTAKALVTAIDWCVDARVDIINLSLGTVNPAHKAAFEAASDRARTAGIIVVAAREADGIPCFPGSLPRVISVGLDWECPRERFWVEAATDGGSIFYASGHPRPIPGVPQQQNLYGISFAVAHMSGFATLACEKAGPSVQKERRAHSVRGLLAGQEM